MASAQSVPPLSRTSRQISAPAVRRHRLRSLETTLRAMDQDVNAEHV